MPEVKKRIYKSYDDYIRDDGDYIVIDPDVTNNVSFLHCYDGFKIPKDFLSDELRWRFLKELDDEPSEPLEEFVRRLTIEIAIDFDKDIKRVFPLTHSFMCRKRKPSPDDIFYSSFISFVLKSELNQEYGRILNVIGEINEEDDDAFIDKLKWKVEYPNETEDERRQREAEYNECENESETSDEHTESVE